MSNKRIEESDEQYEELKKAFALMRMVEKSSELVLLGMASHLLAEKNAMCLAPSYDEQSVITKDAEIRALLFDAKVLHEPQKTPGAKSLHDQWCKKKRATFIEKAHSYGFNSDNEIEGLENQIKCDLGKR